jgi:anti-sigma regulatory factor (Ser/Thr protein kinase)
MNVIVCVRPAAGRKNDGVESPGQNAAQRAAARRRRSTEESLCPTVLAPHRARVALRRFLEGEVGDAVLADLVLVTSELVANAVKHGDGEGPVSLAVAIDDDEIVVTVSECASVPSPFVPRVASSADLLAESGRGLLIVRALSDRLAVAHDGLTSVSATRRL